MSYIKKLSILFLTGLVIVSLSFNLAAQVKEKDLPKKYQDWLKLVAYIITDQERDVFMKLTRDQDRDAFIDTFWKMRDPTPGTPENEYKEEIIKRFEYVNTFFHRGTSREGWQTDMGRIYMILGPPASIERLEGKTGIVPCQIWTYYGDVNKGLPVHFELIFFQKAGVGEFKLYDPLADGPASLLENKRDLDLTDYESIYETIRKIAPTLADPAITYVPGEYGPSFYQPSPRNAMIMAQILESPKKDINPSYASHFLNYVGLVSTEYLTNFIDSDGSVEVIPDPDTGLNFINFIIAPKNISVDFYEPKKQYFCNFTLNVSLRQKNNLIFQYTREIPVYFPEEAVARVKSNGLAVEDSFPVTEGEYQLTVLLQNSVGKEFSIFEKNLEVKKAADIPTLFGPYIGYKLQKFGRDIHLPFKINETKLVVDPKDTLSASDQLVILLALNNLSEDLRQRGKVVIKIKGMKPENAAEKVIEAELNQLPFSRMVSLEQVLPAKEFVPDYYEIQVRLMDGAGNVLAENKGTFIISAEEAIGHPISQARAVSLSRHQYAFFYALAEQCDKLKRDDLADFYYQATLKSNPNFKEAIVSYCQFLLRTNQFDRVLEVSSKLKDEANNQFDYHFFRGKAYLGKENLNQAIEELNQANSIYNSDTGVLNALGQAYFKAGQKEKAAVALRASLQLNSDQPEVKKLLEEMEKKKS
ncbi:MAG: GWxTD domain-containing protein [Candidatus Saccharicenans sp.]